MSLLTALTNTAINIALCKTFFSNTGIQKIAIKVFSSNKYFLVTLLFMHLLTQWPTAIDVVETLSWLLCKQ